VNGALQVRGQDYTATNGTSVVMTAALAVNDVVEIFAYTAFTVANAYTKSETDSLVGAAPGLKLLVPTSVAVGSGSASIGTAGQVTFTGASSVSINGVFSSTYDSYRIMFHVTSASANNYPILRLRASGTDNSSSNYNFGIRQFGYNQTGAVTSLVLFPNSGNFTSTPLTQDPSDFNLLTKWLPIKPPAPNTSAFLFII
jgi:hypothetical protein